MTKMGKTVIIGLDGVPYGMIEDFARSGVMPNMAALIRQGIFKKMQSSIPEISSVAWSSIITGKNPAEHGIFGFIDLFDGSYKMRFPNFNDLKVRPFWEEQPGKSVIVNVPSTYPVRQMNGVHISGFVSINLEKSIHPQSLIPQLQEFDYRLDVDSSKAHSSMDLFLSDLDKTLDARIETYRYLWDNVDWQTFMFVFTGTDRLMHFLWEAYEDENHKYHNVFLEHFAKIDKVIGEISDQISDNDLLVMLSDHGFERLDYDVYISHVLKEAGFLQFKDGQDITLNNITDDTKAFVLDPSRIYLNFKGKYPCGTVTASQGEDVLCQLEEQFSSLEINGQKVIRDIYRKHQIFSGLYLDEAPDMVLVSNEGFNLRGNLKAPQLFDKGIFTGKHTQDTAFLLIKGLLDNSMVPEYPSVGDVKGIIETTYEIVSAIQKVSAK